MIYYQGKTNKCIMHNIRMRIYIYTQYCILHHKIIYFLSKKIVFIEDQWQH